MASARYTRNIRPEDLKTEPPRELTPKEKLANWWDYNWKWVLIGAAVVLLVVLSLRETLLRPKPDYQVGIVTRRGVPEEAANQLSKALQALGEDLNGDGKVLVEINTYQMDMRDPQEIEQARKENPAGNPSDLMGGMQQVADQTRLSADLQSGELVALFTDDPENLQLVTGVLAAADGSPVQDTTRLEGAAVYDWASCPALTGLEMGEYMSMEIQEPHPAVEVFQNLALVRAQRSAKHPERQEAGEKLFAKMIEGATPR